MSPGYVEAVEEDFLLGLPRIDTLQGEQGQFHKKVL
jgi:hypothetical protein